MLYEGQADDSGAITIENGKYEPMTNTLYIDLNSGKNRSGQGVIDYTIMQTVAHETTHFIARNSKSGYATLQSLVRKTLEERGQDFDELVRQKVRIAENSGVELTREGAVEEVMANASEMMLKDTKVFQQLAKQNKSLVEKVKTFVSDLLSKIRKALGKVGAQHPEAKALMEAEQYVAGLQETWDAALMEALETVKGSETEASASAENVETVKGSETGETWNGIPVVDKFELRDSNGNDVVLQADELEENKKRVASMQPLIELTGNDFSTDYYEKALDYYKPGNDIAENPILGDVHIEKSGLNHLMDFLSYRKTALIPAIKAVIEGGEIVYYEPMHKSNPWGTAIIAGKVILDGKSYYMGVSVRHLAEQDTRYYIHDAILVDSKKTTTPIKNAGDNAVTAQSGSPSIYSILLSIRKYNTSSEKFSLREKTGKEQQRCNETSYKCDK